MTSRRNSKQMTIVQQRRDTCIRRRGVARFVDCKREIGDAHIAAHATTAITVEKTMCRQQHLANGHRRAPFALILPSSSCLPSWPWPYLQRRLFAANHLRTRPPKSTAASTADSQSAYTLHAIHARLGTAADVPMDGYRSVVKLLVYGLRDDARRAVAARLPRELAAATACATRRNCATSPLVVPSGHAA